MSKSTVYSAVVAKRADAESKRLRALATVWELESIEKHAMLLQTVLRDHAQQYVDSIAEASFFERALSNRDLDQLEEDADFAVAAYTHDLSACRIANLQLDHLEDIAEKKGVSFEDMDLGIAECRLNECLDSILSEAETHVSSTTAQ